VKGEPVEGIALMDHPDSPWAPCPWFTRDYGNISPMPFNWIEEPWRLPAGRSVRVRHRVVMFAGTPAEAGLDRLYDEWIRLLRGAFYCPCATRTTASNAGLGWRLRSNNNG